MRRVRRERGCAISTLSEPSERRSERARRAKPARERQAKHPRAKAASVPREANRYRDAFRVTSSRQTIDGCCVSPWFETENSIQNGPFPIAD